jgi:hypothetical protein
VPDLSDWNQLDAVAFHVSMKRSVHRFAVVAALLGCVILACGFAAHFAPLIVIGVVLVGAGIWNGSRPTVTGLIVDGVAMVVTGACMCLAALWAEHTRATSLGKSIVVGIVQIVWGVRRLALVPLARSAPADPQAIARLETVVRELSKRNAKEDPNVAEFWTGRVPLQRNRLGFYSEGAIALLQHQAVRLERRNDIGIDVHGRVLGRVSVRIQMSDFELAGLMSPEHYERFERWKQGVSRPSPIAA